MLAVRPPQVTSERASLGIDDAGVSAEGTGTSVVSVSGKVKYDLPDPIAELQDAVGLTRGTIKARSTPRPSSRRSATRSTA